MSREIHFTVMAVDYAATEKLEKKESSKETVVIIKMNKYTLAWVQNNVVRFRETLWCWLKLLLWSGQRKFDIMITITLGDRELLWL